MGGPPATGRITIGVRSEVAVRVAAPARGHGVEAARVPRGALEQAHDGEARAPQEAVHPQRLDGVGAAAGVEAAVRQEHRGDPAPVDPEEGDHESRGGAGPRVNGHCPHLHVVHSRRFPVEPRRGARTASGPGSRDRFSRPWCPRRAGRANVVDPAPDGRRLHRPYPIRAAVGRDGSGGGSRGRGPGATPSRRRAASRSAAELGGAGLRRRRDAPGPPGPCPRAGSPGGRRRGGGAAGSRGGAPPTRPRCARPRSRRARSRPARRRARTAVDGRPSDHDA